MARRKKWRIQLLPILVKKAASSKKQAYEMVVSYREDYELGLSRVYSVVVELDEGDGRGWRRYEMLDFRSGR